MDSTHSSHKQSDQNFLAAGAETNHVSNDQMDRKRLEESEEKYRSLFDTMDQGFCIIDMIFDQSGVAIDYRFVECNPVFGKQTGLVNPVGKTALELVPNLEERWFNIYGAVALTGNPIRFVEGSEAMGRWFEVYAYRLGGEQSRRVAILFTDITERKKSEIELKESEYRFRNLADDCPMFVFILEPNAEAKVSYWNKTWLRYTGQSFEAALGRAWNGIIHPEDVPIVMEIYVPAFSKREAYFIPAVRVKRYDGEYRWHAFKGNPRYQSDGEFNGYVGVGYDVDEQKITSERLEVLINERTLELQRSNEDLQQFAHVASHDLKEPIRKIRIFGERLTREFGDELKDDAKTYLSKIEKAAIRVNAMVDGVLLYSSLDAEEEMTEQVDLNTILRDIESDLEIIIAEKGAVIRYESLPAIQGRRLLIYQLFYNLLNNSIKFSRADVVPTIEISAGTVQAKELSKSGFEASADNYQRISIKDNGIGFSNSDADKIFKTFSRLHPKDKYEGTGLGLALCKKIVERHSGFITANGGENEGASFEVFLP